MRPSGPLQLALIVLLVAQWTGWHRPFVVAQRVPTVRVALPQGSLVSAEAKSWQSLLQRFDAACLPCAGYPADGQDATSSQMRLMPRLSISHQLDPIDGLMSRQC